MWLTHAGMVAEQVMRAFWPFFSILMALLAALMLGLQDLVRMETVWVCAADRIARSDHNSDSRY